MRLIRRISAVLVAFAVVLGSILALPAPRSLAGDMDAAMAADEAMPSCPACTPFEAAKAICAPACAAFAAILPTGAVIESSQAATEWSLSRIGQLDDQAVGPEPYPPKTFILV